MTSISKNLSLSPRTRGDPRQHGLARAPSSPRACSPTSRRCPPERNVDPTNLYDAMRAIAEDFGHPAQMPRAGDPKEIGAVIAFVGSRRQQLHDRRQHQRRRRLRLHLTCERSWSRSSSLSSARRRSRPRRSRRVPTRCSTTLTVKGRAPKTGYAREQFGAAWADVDRNGCDTRDDILNRDLRDKQWRPGTRRCVVVAGRLNDPYTGEPLVFAKTRADAVQIDHVVALSDAWQKGAAAWDASRTACVRQRSAQPARRRRSHELAQGRR